MGVEKRLERILSDRVLGGVCSGLGRYFNLDPTIVRLFFCIAFFVFGTGLLLYLILWLAMPAYEESRETRTEVTEEGATTPTATANTRNSNLALGIILIVTGALLTACNFIPELSLRKLWPVAIIAIGIVMLVNAFKKKEP